MGAIPPEDALLAERQRLGAHIRALRERRGWSQDTLAHLTGLNRSYPHKIEAGLVDLRHSTLLRLAHALDLTLAELVTAEEP